MAVQRLNNQGVRGLAPLFSSGRVGAPIKGHPVYSRLLLVSRFGRPNGATITLNNGRGVISWDAETKEWRKTNE